MPRKSRIKLCTICVGKNSISACLRLAIFLSVLTIVGGDIELNPGPGTGAGAGLKAAGKGPKQRTLSFAEVAGSPTGPSGPPPSQEPYRTRAASKASNDSEVMTFLREMKSDMKNEQQT